MPCARSGADDRRLHAADREESVEQDLVESCQPALEECSQERIVDQCSSKLSLQIEVHIAVASQPVLQEHSSARFVEHLVEIPVPQSTM